MTIPSALVEKAKQAQKNAPKLPCPECSFDEAIFQVVRHRLKRHLSDVSGLGTISEDSEVFAAFRAFVISQIEALVDVAIHALFAQDHVMVGHPVTPGKRWDIISVHHDVVQRRARQLVADLEPHREERAARKRVSGVRVTVANVMNTTNWEGMTRSFWRGYAATPGNAS